MLAAALLAHAGTIRVLALFQGKAILQIDGKRRVLSAGETSPEGVRLVSADADGAVIEHDGRRERLSMELIAGTPDTSGPARITLYADRGFFYADGSINGTPVRFLVDTGANTIAMNAALARRIGIDYSQGERGIATTASGYAPMYRVYLNTVKVGGIVLHNVAAGVIEGPQPQTPLLGMSFLHAVEMHRDGDRMELIKRN